MYTYSIYFQIFPFRRRLIADKTASFKVLQLRFACPVTQDNVKVLFGAGCVQAVLYSMCDTGACILGLTDPSARLPISKDLLSFSIPYARFLEMEDNVPESFLTGETWRQIQKRL